MSATNWSIDNAVEIKLNSSDDFLKIKETLTRIGIPSKKNNKNTLYQTAHILNKRGKYYIVHFKCLFSLDHKTAPFIEEDWKRQNRIAKLMKEWNLCDIVYEIDDEDMVPIDQIKILRFGEKKDWNLVTKYNLGVYNEG